MGTSRYKRKGKSKFLMLEGYIYRSAAWQSLTPNDKTVYFELKWRYDGFNNGRIGLGERELAEALRISRETARRSLAHLIEKGFIEKTRLSGFNVKNRMATEWRITEYACDRTGHPASKEFMRWPPPENHFTGAPIDHTGANNALCPQEIPKKRAHRGISGPVRTVSGISQGRNRSTYNITIQGGDSSSHW